MFLLVFNLLFAFTQITYFCLA